jgi:sugar/nucleoside kinase (ribokinase family)
MTALVAAVSGRAEVARTSATVEEKVECVQQFLHWTTGSPNIYKPGGYSNTQAAALANLAAAAVVSQPGNRLSTQKLESIKAEFVKGVESVLVGQD